MCAASSALNQLTRSPKSFRGVDVITGVKSAYQWLEADHNFDSFLALCPQVFEGKHLAITAVDSGSFIPSEADLVAGWRTDGNIAYSPLLRLIGDLPNHCYSRDCGPFDEWYVFGSPVELGELCNDNVFTAEIAPGRVFAFVNFNFRPSDPKIQEITDLFWRQIEWMQPESYLAEVADCLIFATANKTLFASVHAALESDSAS
jgi:hypothetical protein